MNVKKAVVNGPGLTPSEADEDLLTDNDDNYLVTEDDNKLIVT